MLSRLNNTVTPLHANCSTQKRSSPRLRTRLMTTARSMPLAADAAAASRTMSPWWAVRTICPRGWAPSTRSGWIHGMRANSPRRTIARKRINSISSRP